MSKKGAGGEAAAASAPAEELPRSIVRRVVKDKLSQLSGGGGGGEEREGTDTSVHKESLLAFSESARIFIHYLSATANDICKESKRQTINAEDVFKALEEIEFPEFIDPLRASLEDFRQKNLTKKSANKEKEGSKKRKIEESPAKNGEEAGMEDSKEENEDEDGPDADDDHEADGHSDAE